MLTDKSPTLRGPTCQGVLGLVSLFFDTGLLFPRIRAPPATFKAVLIAADMTKALQTK